MFRFRRQFLCSGTALALLSATAAYSVELKYNFNVPRGDLGKVITQIARTAGIQISFPANLTAGRQAGPIVMNGSVREALARATAGTSLSVVPGRGDALTLRAAGDAQAVGGGGDIETIDVSDNRSTYHDDGFQAGDAGVTTRIVGAAAKEIPITISTVTKKVLESQGTTDAETALQNIAGVVAIGQQSGSQYVIRGFQVQAGRTLIDGDQGIKATTMPIDDIERVEVLKGPTSILTGVTLEGGGINYATKKPTEETIRTLVARYGSNGYKTIAADLGGRIEDLEGVTYRLNASANDANEDYAGYKNPREFLVSPQVQWQGEDLTVSAGIRYWQKHYTPGLATTLSATAADPLNGYVLRRSRSTSPYNNKAGTDVDDFTAYSDQSYHIGSVFGLDLTLNNHLNYTTESVRARTFTTYGAPNSAGQFAVSGVYVDYTYPSLTERPDLTAQFENDLMKSTTKIGYDFASREYNSSTWYPSRKYTDLNNPFQLLPIMVNRYDGSTVPYLIQGVKYQTNGYYLTEKIDTLDDRLHILGMVRNDRFASGTTITYPTYNEKYVYDYHQTAMSWSAGAVFDVTPWMSVYGTKSDGFSAQFGINSSTGAALPPQERNLSEVGARFYLFDKKLTLTTSVYDLKQSNVAITDPADPTGLRSILIKGQSSKGYEIEAQGEIFPGFALIGSFSSVIVKYDDSRYSTTPFPGTPRNTASLWGVYTFDLPEVRGLSVGLGAHGMTSSVVNYEPSSITYSYKVPGYAVADAMISYEQEDWELQFKLNNIFNKYYYTPSLNAYYIPIGQGRNFMTTFKYRF